MSAAEAAMMAPQMVTRSRASVFGGSSIPTGSLFRSRKPAGIFPDSSLPTFGVASIVDLVVPAGTVFWLGASCQWQSWRIAKQITFAGTAICSQTTGGARRDQNGTIVFLRTRGLAPFFRSC
jgi:hypothetical protein